MALIACTECNHEVSDRASRCPHCGAPTSRSAKGWRGVKRALYGLLAVLLLAWAALTVLWLGGRISSPSQIAELLHSHDRGTPAQITQPPLASGTASSTASVAPNATLATRAVYQTSVQQLYEDYNANAVATQSKIGDSHVRITGQIADINQDSTGHPIIT